MFLKQIKIVGFKSFVEPTVLYFNSDRVAVVGPNGCGKSNVIDAIRWVMGESSPKFLRGDLMSDVIFNGSLQRKPVSMASVEIVLDNQNAYLQGAYVVKGDVALRREVNRSGDSTYYINGHRVRRKDLTDLWLGTGAGARGYAIIGQNMVNHLVEANPDVLRGYLEEAAGVSKYKERRKESAERLAIVSENLARIEDIIFELHGQLGRLEKEASDAALYNELRQKLRQHQESLELAKAKVLYEKNMLLDELVTAEETLEQKLQLQCDEMSTAANAMEDEYHCSQERLQQEQHQLHQQLMTCQQQEQLYQQREHYQQERLQLIQEHQDLKVQLEREQQQIADLFKELNILKQQSLEIQQSTTEWRQKEQNIKNKLRDAHQERHGMRQKSQQSKTDLQVLLARQEQTQQNLMQIQSQIQKWQQLSKNQDVPVLEQKLHYELQELNPKQALLLEKKNEVVQLQEKIQALAVGYAHAKQQKNQMQTLCDVHMRALMLAQASYQGLLTTLEGQDLKHADHLEHWTSITQWIQQWNIPGVWKSIVDWLWQNFLPGFTGNTHGHDFSVSGFYAQLQDMDANASTVKLARLLDVMHVKSYPAGFLHWSHIYVAEHSDMAYQYQSQLQWFESIITPCGVWLGVDWVYVLPKNDLKTEGLATRLQAYKQAEALLQQTQTEFSILDAVFFEIEKEYFTFQDALEGKQKSLDALNTEINLATQHYQSLKQQLQLRKQEQARNKQEWIGCEQQYAVLIEQNNGWHQKIARIQDDLNTIAAQEQVIAERISSLGDELSAVEQQLTRKTQSYDALQLQLTRMQTQYDFYIMGLPKLQQRLQHIADRQGHIEKSSLFKDSELSIQPESFEQIKDAIAKQQLQWDEKSAQVKRVSQRRQEMLKELDQLKKQHLAVLEKKWRFTTEKQQISLELEELKRQWVEDFSPHLWQNLAKQHNTHYFKTLIQGIEQQLTALGDVNLLAVGLFEQEKNRHQHVLEQQNDLKLAMAELQIAIETLDGEMQIRLQNTLSSINTQLLEIFPQLFGGGEAKFVASCDNLLEAAVAVEVQLPGKKKHRIQLLSGGEKALTAVALLFAIFSLNPAPFCLLDEVDAALDDANVVRLARLIKNMSNTVQFVLITHNPLTMDVADEWIGVTMQEPGISRVVSVNMAMALAMVNKE